MHLNKVRSHKNAWKSLVAITLITILIFLYLSTRPQLLYRGVDPSELYIIRWNMSEDITCHYSVEGDMLQLANENFSPPNKSIFFLETSCRGGLTSRQACAVESAAKAHPSWKVHVLFSSPVTEFVLQKTCLSTLMSYDNVVFRRVHIAEYAKGSPMEKLVEQQPYNKSTWRIEHSSDVLRYLTLYKYGGIYLDTDTLVVKSLDSLVNNWAARESAWAVDAGALSFSKDPLGREIAKAAIK
jgi:lactosylceramide 4-alpha-galactosyltransferase